MSDYIGALAEQTGFSAASGLIGGTLGEIFGGLDDRRQVSQQHRLTDIQLDAQKNMMDYGYQKQMDMWNATNYPAQMQQLEKAGLNPGLMYAKGGPGGVTGTPTGSVTGATAQQNPGEIMQAMGIANQNSLLQSQRKLVDAQARETNVRADKEAGVDTELGKTQIASLTQGIQNQKAIEVLTKAQSLMQSMENVIVGHTMKEREDYIVAQTQQAQELVMQAEQQTFIDRATAHAKADIIRTEAIGQVLQNALTQAQTGQAKAATQVDYAQIHKMAQDIAQGWTDLSQKEQQIKLNEWMNQAEIKLGNKAIWVGGVSRILEGGIGILKNMK